MNRRAAILVALLAVAAACDELPGGAQAPEDETSTAIAPAAVEFDGYIVPINATELRAPQNSFRVGSWSRNSSWIKLIHLADDGAEVKEGDIVAKFEFPGDEAREYVDREIRNAEAQRDRSGLEKEQQVEELTSEEAKKKIDADRAQLDTLRRGVISERDWELSKIAHKQAEFDAVATGKQRRAVQQELRAESNYHERNVARAQSLDTRYKSFEERFVVRAPHDGVFRHAYFRRRGRKVQKGDGMPAGNHFGSIARDKSVSVQFFVPERHYGKIGGIERFVVESATSKSTWTVELDRVEQFPQELGFLKNDNGLPTAREKAYVVWASFAEQPQGLSAGVEVRVRTP